MGNFPKNYKPIEPESGFERFKGLRGRLEKIINFDLLAFPLLFALFYTTINAQVYLNVSKNLCSGLKQHQIEASYENKYYNEYLKKLYLGSTHLGRNIAYRLQDEGIGICDYLPKK